jgi:hypothetical protein
MLQETFTYQPGVCNIDNKGVRWRRKLGYICLFVGLISMGVIYEIHLGQVLRFIIGAGFGFAAALNLIQAKEHFCVMNASKRTYETSLHKTKITDDLYKDADVKKRRSMIAKSLIYAALAGCLGLLPL